MFAGEIKLELFASTSTSIPLAKKHTRRTSAIEFDIECTVHRNQLQKQSNKMHFLYVFILQFLYNSTCFERPFRSSSGVNYLLYLQLCCELQIQ